MRPMEMKHCLYALNTLVRGKKMDTQDYCGELVDIVPDNSRKAYDVLEVIELYLR